MGGHIQTSQSRPDPIGVYSASIISHDYSSAICRAFFDPCSLQASSSPLRDLVVIIEALMKLISCSMTAI